MTTQIKEVILPSSEADRKKIKDALQEISNAKTRIAGEKDYIKETVAKLSEDFNIPKSFLNKLANAFHNDSFDKVNVEAETLESARELILK